MSGERTSVLPGGLVGGRFRLEHPIGRGAMGSVWTAWHTTLNVRVAIKFIGTELAARQDLRSRFEQEAQAAAMIDSPHVVRVIDHGVDDTGRPYIAMELLEGQSLADRLKQEPILSIGLLARIITHASKGLAKAHKLGIIHRDIKPENLFLTQDEDEGTNVKVLDFGIAKATTFGGKAHQTGTGHLMGTPHYMSPEQALGNKQIDHRSDLYSLGVVAYRCLCGTVPFDSEGLGALIVGITTQPHAPMSVRRPDLGTAFDAWFNGALAKDPNHRFQHARDMAKAFVEVAKNLEPRLAGIAAPSDITMGSWNDTTGVHAGPPSGLPKHTQPLSPVAPMPASTAAPVAPAMPSTPSAAPPASPPVQATLQGAAAPIDDPPVLPMRRSVALPIVLVVLLGLGGLAGAGIWWKTRSASVHVAPSASNATALPVESVLEPAVVPAESTAPPADAEAVEPITTTPPPVPTKTAPPPAVPPSKTAPPAKSAPPTGTAPPASVRPPRILRGCTSNEDCKGNRVCVKGACKDPS